MTKGSVWLLASMQGHTEPITDELAAEILDFVNWIGLDPHMAVRPHMMVDGRSPDTGHDRRP